MTDSLNCFKAYDIRGQVPSEFNPKLADKIAQAYYTFLKPKLVVIGQDMRLSSPDIANALIQGLLASGANVIDIDQCGTEEVYFATTHFNACGGMMITASHNPKDYNGLKLVRENAKPISSDTGLKEIESITINRGFSTPAKQCGQYQKNTDKTAYLKHLLTYIDINQLKPFKIVTNAGNGMAGPIIDALESLLPFQFIKIQNTPDGHFPNGVPNPLLTENRTLTSQTVIKNNAHFGIAWDGDFDRCFFFDEKGQFIESYYIIGLLAEYFLKKYGPNKILHDPRLTWNTQAIVKQHNGTPIETKTGHAFIKERMRGEDAIYGGEMSGHHYFKAFNYCDSGMIPWLLISQILSETNQTLSSLVKQQIKKFPISGELNFKVNNPESTVQSIINQYTPQAKQISRVDGISMEFDDWRFNLRQSNTEPLIRLNIESRQNIELLHTQTSIIKKYLQ